MIGAKYSFKNNALERLLGALGPAGKTRVLAKWGTRAAAYVGENKLTGQVLKVRSGDLRKSLMSSSTGAIKRGQSVLVGTNKVYGAIHEFGGTIVPKNAKSLRFQVGGRWVTTQKVKIPKRPWLIPGVTEFKDSRRGQEMFWRYLRTEAGL